MPLDASSYSLALLRLDGRRWNELRHFQGQISTQAAADGSSYLEMGNTKVICTVNGPSESRRAPAGGQRSEAEIVVEVNLAGFSGVDRKRRRKGDKRISEIQHIIGSAFSKSLFTNLYQHSTITVTLHALSQDGSLLAALLNAATLALVDAGIPMKDYIAACTAGSTASYAQNDEQADPLLDLNAQEELELPFLTLATLGESEKVVVCMMETRVQVERLESMLAVGVDGCRRVRGLLDEIVRVHGRKAMGLEGR
ncbi:MAG: Exosome non-catalytic core component [Bogoriella megaspora]|nr:MAG: Exosome non-catalytic core component [Bogoriella megaspora]